MGHTRISRSKRRSCEWRHFMLLLPILLLFFAVPFLCAGSTPAVTGSYTVLQHTARGSEAQVLMRIHLVNRSSSDLSIQRMTPWGLLHPEKGASRACSLTLRAHSSLETTQQFIVRRSEYQLWQRGLRPRLVLELQSPGGAAGTTSEKSTVELDRVSLQEAK